MKENVTIEGYLGQLDEHLDNLQSLLPDLEFIGFSSKSMAGIGKSMTVTIDSVSIFEAELIEKYLIDNTISFVAEFGSHRFYNCQEDGDWHFLTGQPSDPPVNHISMRDIVKIYKF